MWAVVVTQLVEWSFLTQEYRGSNTVIGKFYLPSTELNLHWKYENSEKEAVNGPFLINHFCAAVGSDCFMKSYWHNYALSPNSIA